MNRFSRL